MARTEISSERLPTRPYAVIDMTAPQAARSTEIIASVDDDTLRFSNHVDHLAFNEELLDIRIEPSSERNSPSMRDFSVNGDRRWLPVGVPIRIQRKFVEVMARSMVVGITTEVGTAMEENPKNLIHRSPFRLAPFSVLHDPNPKGTAWLNKISYER